MGGQWGVLGATAYNARVLGRKKEDYWLQTLRDSEEALLECAERLRDAMGEHIDLLDSPGNPHFSRLLAACLSSSAYEASSHLLVCKCLDSQDYVVERYVAAILLLQDDSGTAEQILVGGWVLAQRAGIPNTPTIKEWFFDVSRLKGFFAESFHRAENQPYIA